MSSSKLRIFTVALIAIAVLLARAPYAPAQIFSAPTIWTLVQDVIPTCGVPASTCTIPTAATGKGNLALIFMSTFGTTISSISGDTFTHCLNQGGNLNTCQISDPAVDQKDAWYDTSLTGGTTSFVATMTGTETGFLGSEFQEWHKLGGVITADASGSADVGGSSAVSDSFPTMGALDSNWSTAASLSGPATVVTSGNVGVSAMNSALGYWATIGFANNQHSEFTVTAIPADTLSSVGPAVRIGASGNGYAAVVQGMTGSLFLEILTGLSKSYLGGSYATVTVGQTVDLSVSGTTLTLLVNGSSVGTATDSTYTSGSPGYYEDNESASAVNGTLGSFVADSIPDVSSGVCLICAGPVLTQTGTNDLVTCNGDTSFGPPSQLYLPALLSPWRNANVASSFSGYVLNASNPPLFQFFNGGWGEAISWCMAFK